MIYSAANILSQEYVDKIGMLSDDSEYIAVKQILNVINLYYSTQWGTRSAPSGGEMREECKIS